MVAVNDNNTSRTSLVLFGTETGTSQDFAFELSRTLERLRFVVSVDDFDNVVPSSLSKYAVVVFVLSTTGQGEFPSNARKFWTSLLKKKLSSTYLDGVTYALVGIGDSSYPKFNFAARKLDKRVKQLGAVSFLQPCEADEQGEDSTDGAFISWSHLFKSSLVEKFPLPAGQAPIPDGEVLASKWTLALHGDCEVVNGGLLSSPAASSPSLRSEDVTFQVTLERNDRITPTDHWQDVRLIKLGADVNVQYFPGDALAIRPKNMPEDVQQLIQLMQWSQIADKQLCFEMNPDSTQMQQLPDSTLSTSYAYTLRQLLTDNLDINAIPRRSFFAAIANYTSNEMHKERLLEFTDPQYLDEYYDYATRPRRSILEILQEFDSVKIPWQEVINVFPILRSRQFSIASGGQLKREGTSFDLLVAIVKYRTVIKRTREGVCTRYLARLEVGDRFDVELKTEGRLHKHERTASKNHLLVGAGTGIAPLRSILYEKQRHESVSTLIFGCRSSKADYFFQDEWQDMIISQPQGSFNLVTAFSRDQRQKIYIQDKIREHETLVKKHLYDPNSMVVVCGSSGAMPKAVRAAFVDVLCSDAEEAVQEDPLSMAEAEQFLIRMEKEGRYKQETW